MIEPKETPEILELMARRDTIVSYKVGKSTKAPGGVAVPEDGDIALVHELIAE